MRINRQQLKEALTHFAGNSHVHPHEHQRVRDTALTALEYIRQLEADLRRQGFTEYNTKEEDNDQ
jgi:hypothetical protein